MTIYNRKNLVLMSIILLMLITFFSYCYKHSSDTPEHRLQWWLKSLNWNDERTRNGKGIKIAVIDTGIDSSHPDLKGSIVTEYRVSQLASINKANDFEHGTMVAGIISAFPSLKNGVLGVAPESEIISIDVSDSDGMASIETLTEAIEFALSQDVDIINISMGLEGYSSELHKVIKKVYEEGIVIVAAAGNDIYGKVLYPAKFNEVICVGATSKKGDFLYDYDDELVAVFLPGENIVTTFSSYEYDIDKKYTSSTGSSVSAPILSGIIALVLESKDSISNDEIKDYFSTKKIVDNIPDILKDFHNK